MPTSAFSGLHPSLTSNLRAKKHLAQLNNSDQTFPAVVLLGDDLIEGFETEGDQDLFISDKWPPLDLRDWWTDPQLDDTVFNAGVSGDKFANIIHRLVGDMDYDDPNLPGLAGLRPILKSRKVKLWVVHAGTNNLSPPYGLSNEQVRQWHRPRVWKSSKSSFKSRCHPGGVSTRNLKKLSF